MRPNILDFTRSEEFSALTLEDLGGNLMTKEEFVHMGDVFKAFWEYDGAPSADKPHAKLTNGKHSNGYVNCSLFLCEPELARIFAWMMHLKLKENFTGSVDWVIGPSEGVWPLVTWLGYFLKARCWVTEKGDDNKPSKWKRLVVEPGKKVLIVNELMTNGNGSVWQSKEGVGRDNPHGVDFVDRAILLVNRSEDNSLADETPVDAVFNFDMQNIEPDHKGCRYCNAGSNAIPPKTNWAQLTGKA
jgi:orotate phosphoribosyltransferase